MQKKGGGETQIFTAKFETSGCISQKRFICFFPFVETVIYNLECFSRTLSWSSLNILTLPLSLGSVLQVHEVNPSKSKLTSSAGKNLEAVDQQEASGVFENPRNKGVPVAVRSG